MFQTVTFILKHRQLMRLNKNLVDTENDGKIKLAESVLLFIAFFKKKLCVYGEY